MAKRIIWSDRAKKEKKEILHYWRKRNQSSTYSKKLQELIKETTKMIAAHPNLGRQIDFGNIRVKTVRDYLIFYKELNNDTIVILSIWDSRNDPGKTPY